jgi:glycosyltransferase involved in cell wall biosynthesis
MRLAVTLLVKNEIDIISDTILFHFKMGADELIITDNDSSDGTLEEIERLARHWPITVIREGSDIFDQATWVTRMALIAKERKADWIVNADADEFWYHPIGLKAFLEKCPLVPLRTYRRNLLPPPYQPQRPVKEMTLAVMKPTPRSENIGDYLLWQLTAKEICPARSLLSVAMGNHSARYAEPCDVQQAGSIVIYHYPLRSFEQFKSKVSHGGAALNRNLALSPGIAKHWRKWFADYEAGRLQETYRTLAMLGAVRAEHIRNGVLATDSTIADMH